MLAVNWDNVLVLQTSFLGDLVLTLPLIAEKARLQHQHIVPIHREHFLDRHRLVDQHHWDVVLDRVHQPAGLTNQSVPLVIEVDVPFAFGTGENVEQILTDCHGYSLQFGLQIQIRMSLA